MTTADALAVLRCPVCRSGFSSVGEKTISCDQKHTFDFGKDGHLHLLPSGHGSTNRSGDTREMLRARRRFFDRGCYAAIADAVVSAVAVSFGAEDAAVFVDVGCGEGYYAEAIQKHFHQSTVIGTDLAKDAIQLAAKGRKGPLFVVADTLRLPLKDASVDAVVDVFAPRSAGEFARVVKPGGVLVVAVPGPDHLRELRALTGLGIEPDKEEKVQQQLDAAFEFTGAAAVDEALALDADAVADLVTMTPHHRHAAAPATQATTVTLQVRVLRFRRR